MHQAAPVRDPEDGEQGEDRDPDRPHRDGELLAHGVGEDGRPGRAGGEGRHQERLLGAGAAWRERQGAGDRLDTHHQQHVLGRASDVEGVEEEPEREEAAEPAGQLPSGHLAQVATRPPEDRQTLLDPLPERVHALGEDREEDHEPDAQHGQGQRQHVGVCGPE